MTDSALLAEARIIARTEVNNLAAALNVAPVTVFRTDEELSIGMARLREKIYVVQDKANRLRQAIQDANDSLQLYSARMRHAFKQNIKE